MVYVLAHYKKPSANLITKDGLSFPITSILSFRNQEVKDRQQVFIAERVSRLKWKIHEVIVLDASSEIEEAVPLDSIWGKMVEYWSKGTANLFDIFVTCKVHQEELSELVQQEVEIDYLAHPGVYVFEKEKLQNIEVTKNNRGVLLPARTVEVLTRDSAEQGLFVFMPSWYMAYAENRPADLYLAQKQEFDALNSASRRR
jgi:hypothetical protein